MASASVGAGVAVGDASDGLGGGAGGCLGGRRGAGPALPERHASAVVGSRDFRWMWYADIVLALLAAVLNLPIREAAIERRVATA